MSKKPGRRPFGLKKSVSRIGKDFSSHADRVADIIIEDNKKGKGAKAKEVTRETLSLFRGMRHDLWVDAAYGLGKLSGKTKRACSSVLSRIKK